MAIRIAIFAFPIAAGLVLVEVLNGLDAAPGVAAAALGFTALLGGVIVGVFADRLPALRLRRRHHRFIPHHVD